MPVNFSRLWAWENGVLNQDVNDIFSKISALGGVYDTDTSQVYASSTGFTMPYASGSFYATALFNFDLTHDIEVPSDYTVVFDVFSKGHGATTEREGGTWAIAVNIPVAANPTDEYLFFGNNFSDAYTFGTMSNNTPHVPITTLSRSDFYAATAASTNEFPKSRYTVSVRQFYLDGDVNKLWAIVQAWHNLETFGAYAIPLASEIETSYIRFGQVRTSVGTIHHPQTRFANITVRKVAETIEAAAVDPGEPPLAGLQRSIDGLYLKFWMRQNGDFKLYRPGTIESSQELSHDRIEGLYENFDNRALRSHVRMAGAYAEAEYIDEELRSQIGYRFELANNPFLLTSTVCRAEAKRFINRLKSEANTIQFSMPASLLLEYEDRITIVDEFDVETDWVVQSINYSVTMTDIMQSITARKYVADA
jgi:hypothetical protein